MARHVGATLATQVRAYIEHRAADPTLTAESIAAALAVSRRHLYRVCARAGISIEQSIISARLARARSQLADPALAGRSVAVIAAACGFTDVNHFRRRFKRALGMTPQDWRRAHLGGP